MKKMSVALSAPANVEPCSEVTLKFSSNISTACDVIISGMAKSFVRSPNAITCSDWRS